MKIRFALIPVFAVAASAAYVVLHPGVAYAEPRLAGPSTELPRQTATYAVDRNHATVGFEIAHLGLSTVHGRFNKFEGKVTVDEKNLDQCGVSFTIQTDSVDTSVAPRDNHLRSADFFEVEKYPTITFKSTKLVKTSEGYTLTGDLRMKEKSKSIEIPFKVAGPYKMGNQPSRIGIVAAPFKIKRSDFGVGSTNALPDGVMVIADELTVRLSF